MWNRNLDLKDPLLKMFYDTYHLNLLSVPREKASIGDLYIDDGRRVSTPGNIAYFLEGTEKFEMPRASTEHMSDVTGISSNNISIDVGLSFLEGFLGVLGAGAIFSKLRGAYQSSSVKHIKFRFTQATRDSIDIFMLGNTLYDQKVNEKNAAYNKNDRYYLATAVARSPSVSIIAEGDDSKSIGAEVETNQIADVTADIKMKKTSEHEITVAGGRNIAFGIELHELVYNAKKQTINIRPITEGGMKIRKVQDIGILEHSNRKVIPSFIGSRDDSPFVYAK